MPSLGTKSKDIRVARQLAADITDRARGSMTLGHENDVKQDRRAALRFLDTISSNLIEWGTRACELCAESSRRPPRHRR